MSMKIRKMKKKKKGLQKSLLLLSTFSAIVLLVITGFILLISVSENNLRGRDESYINVEGEAIVKEEALEKKSVEKELSKVSELNTEEMFCEDGGTDSKVVEILETLTLEEKVAQMFFITPEALSGVEKVVQAGKTSEEALKKYPVGGIVYFASNLISTDQTKEMLSNMQKYSVNRINLPIFLGVDEEGGRVLRIGSNPNFGVEKVESMGMLAQSKDINIIYEAGNTIGTYLAELGFNVDFAPDADVLSNSDNQIIGNRSFGTEPDVVAEMSWAYCEGLHNNSILATYKHYPGHGGTKEDSHSEYAYSYKTLEELKENELIPFQSGCEMGVDFIMVSHISLPKVTGSDVPASLSKMLVTDILRQDMGYEGIIITDSLSMGAISQHYSADEAALQAVEAGCDMLLMPSDFEMAYKAILDAVKEGSISQERIDNSVKRIITAKLKLRKG